MTVDEIKDALLEIARQDVARCAQEIRAGGGTIPHFIGMTGDGSIQFYMTPWEDERSKDAITKMLKERFADNGTVGYALVSEVWYMVVRPGETRPPGLPSEYPHLRREALRAMVSTNKGEWSISCEIEREGGEIRVADPVEEDLSAHQSTGRMVGLLPVRH